MQNTLRRLPLAVLLFLQAWNLRAQPLSPPANLPANQWMTTPIPWSASKDPVPSETRLARDQYFDQLIGNREPLTPSNAKGTGISEGVPLPHPSEIPELPNRAIVVATFISYQPVLSRTGKAIYTEVTFAVSNMFEDSSGRAGIGRMFTAIIPGGTVTTNGIELSFLTQPRSHSVSPGKTYLLALSYHVAGDFFMIGKDWVQAIF